MIILANLTHTGIVASMLWDMYQELQPEECSTLMSDYVAEAIRFIETYDVLLERRYRGMVIMENVTNVLTPNLPQWQGVVLYIKPEFRKRRVLKTIYTYLFANYEGDILSLTDINSEHIKVQDKRQPCIAKLYIVNKRK